MTTQRFQSLIQLVQDKYENNNDPGHDFAHILRVLENCRSLGKSVGADLETLLPSALLHDIVNLPKNHPDRLKASEQAAQEALGILKTIGYSEEEIRKIQTVITEHSYSLGRSPSCLESAVLQDADRLDALGAVGLMRTVTCGTRMEAKYYHLEDPFAEKRDLDDKKFTLDHLYTKLFKLADQMNTEFARVEGLKRLAFMKKFVEQLKEEIHFTSY